MFVEGAQRQYQIFGPNDRGEFTVMCFTDHYTVHSRHHSEYAAENALDHIERTYSNVIIKHR